MAHQKENILFLFINAIAKIKERLPFVEHQIVSLKLLKAY
jgi:hypothetical protein